MKYFIVLLLSVFSLFVSAKEPQQFDDSAVELSRTMGLEGLLSSVLFQTKESLKVSMSKVAEGYERDFPNMTVEQKERLNAILEQYVDAVMDSIDTKKAANIYTSVLAKNMTPSEIKTASKYYQSSEGKNLLKTISEAATEMNEYLISTTTDATDKAMIVMGQEINSLKMELMRK